MTTVLVATEEYQDLVKNHPPSLRWKRTPENLTSSFCIRLSNLRATSIPSYEQVHPFESYSAILSCAARSSITLWKGVSKCIDNLHSSFNVTRRSKTLNWLLSTLQATIMTSNLVLETNNAFIGYVPFCRWTTKEYFCWRPCRLRRNVLLHYLCWK